jgi:hypothetical protein
MGAPLLVEMIAESERGAVREWAWKVVERY